MTVEKLKEKYEVDLRLKSFEQDIRSIDKTLIAIENRLDKIDLRFDRIDSKFERINDTMFSHFKWTVLLIFGIYGSTITALLGAVGKAYHWF